jgi:hypothetical protein
MVQLKFAFSDVFNEREIYRALGHDDSGFLIEGETELQSSFLADPAFANCCALAGTVFGLAQLVLALWQLIELKRSQGQAVDNHSIMIQLPTGAVVWLPTEKQEILERFLRQHLPPSDSLKSQPDNEPFQGKPT